MRAHHHHIQEELWDRHACTHAHQLTHFVARPCYKDHAAATPLLRHNLLGNIFVLGMDLSAHIRSSQTQPAFARRIRGAYDLLITLTVFVLLTSCATVQETAGSLPPPLSTEDAVTKLSMIEAQMPAAPNASILAEWENLNLCLAKARYLLDRYSPTEPVLQLLAIELDRADKTLARVLSGEAEPTRLGQQEEAYLAENDASFQPFVRYIPTSARKGTRMPLLVYLHGYSPSLNIVNWAQIPETLVAFAEKNRFCIVAPFGRGNTDFQGIGEQDVLRVIDEMRKRYLIDDDRIILIGFSMGGMGAWTIGAHYPDKFAGLVIISGRGDYYFWQKTARADLPQYKQILIDTEFGHSLLPNLGNIPIYCVHATEDMLVSIDEARHMVKAVREVNPDLVYKEIVGGSHWIHNGIFESDDFHEWIMARRRTAPLTFSYRSYHPKYNQFNWIRVRDFAKREIPAEISVNIIGNAAVITAKGVKSLDISEALMPEAIKRLPVAKNGNFKITFYDRFNTVARPRPVAGPIKEAFLGAFVFVHTAKPGDQRGLVRFRNAVLKWYRFAKAYPQIAYERQITAARLRTNNIILIGEPEDSKLIREVLAKAPFKVTASEFIIGNKSFPRADNGLFAVQPSPWNPSKLVVVQCGIPWGDGLPENHVYDFLPDYIVYTKEYDKDGSNAALCAGMFDEHWRIIPELMSTRK